jgi:hypothetical protein
MEVTLNVTLDQRNEGDIKRDIRIEDEMKNRSI